MAYKEIYLLISCAARPRQTSQLMPAHTHTRTPIGMCKCEEWRGGVVSAVNATHKGHDCCCLAAAFDSAIILTLDSNKNCILFLVLGACNSLQERARVAGISMCVRSFFFLFFSCCSCRQITHTPRTRNGPLVNALAVPMTMTGGERGAGCGSGSGRQTVHSAVRMQQPRKVGKCFACK